MTNGLSDSQIENLYINTEWKLKLFRHWKQKQDEYRLKQKLFQIELRKHEIENDFSVSLADEVLNKYKSFIGDKQNDRI